MLAILPEVHIAEVATMAIFQLGPGAHLPYHLDPLHPYKKTARPSMAMTFPVPVYMFFFHHSS